MTPAQAQQTPKRPPHHRVFALLALSALSMACGKDEPAAAGAKVGAVTQTPTPAAPAAPKVSLLAQLAEYIPPPPLEPSQADTWDDFIAAKLADDEVLVKNVGAVPPNASAVFLADARLIGERDLGFGRLTKETTTPEHLEAVLAHFKRTPLLRLRGYRPRGHWMFIAAKQPDRKALAAEAFAYLQEHGFEDPGNLDAENRITRMRFEPLVSAVWEPSKKRYKALVSRVYGRLAWVDYAGSGSAWMPIKELALLDESHPALIEGPEPRETCSLSVGAKVKAPWSTTRTQLWAGTITEIYGGLARVKFDDGNTGWAHCAREIKPR